MPNQDFMSIRLPDGAYLGQPALNGVTHETELPIPGPGLGCVQIGYHLAEDDGCGGIFLARPHSFNYFIIRCECGAMARYVRTAKTYGDLEAAFVEDR